ncbi:MAG: periplasmic heavy metal sensor [bacterium]
MKIRTMVITAIALIMGTTIAIAQQPQMQPPPKENQAADVMKKLKLTDDQRKEVEKLRVDQAKQGITHRGKRETANLDLQQLLRAESPDKAAIEKKVNEIAQLDAQGKLLKINHWFGVNKILTPDQQKVWKRKLAQNLALNKGQAQQQRVRRGLGMRMQGRQPMRPMMQQRMMMGRQRGMQQRRQMMMQQRGQMMMHQGGQMMQQEGQMMMQRGRQMAKPPVEIKEEVPVKK